MCDKLAISICNYRFRTFTGCNKTFCREHGICHYSPLMVENNQNYVDPMWDEDTKKLVKEITIDRNEIGWVVSRIRVCNDCIEPFKSGNAKYRF